MFQRNRYNTMSRFLSLCLTFLLISPMAFGQGQPSDRAQIEFPLTFSDGIGGDIQVHFGLDVRATEGYDNVAALNEEVAGFPFSFGKDARLIRSTDDERVTRDIRFGAAEDKNLTKVHVLEIKKDDDQASDLTMTWALDSWVSVVLQNADSEVVVTLTGSGSHTFANDSFGDLEDSKFTMTVTYDGIPPGLLPVELTSFTSLVQGSRAVLHWETASETNNAGFEVQQRINGEYQAIGFVNGRGTTTEKQRYTFRTRNLAAGSHDFRLKQIDFDGTFAYSKSVTAQIALAGAADMEKAYPDPFNPQTQFNLTIAREQNVTIAVYDMQGRLVQTLHQGALSPSEAHLFTFEAFNMPSGRYFIRAVGEFFNESQVVTLLK